MTVPPRDPTARFYQSQRLKLHYADWGNEKAPALILIHGGRDHCRNWDALARALQPRFHIIAPDLRGHGDSDWATGSSYSLSDYVYDIAGLIRHARLHDVTIVGHSMGGMIGLMYAGTYPDRVSRLAVLDGVTVLPGRARAPMHEQIAKWIAQLDEIAARKPRLLRNMAEAAARMRTYNERLSPDLALHLATHGARQNPDGTYSWKFDPYQQARAPYRLSPEDYRVLWSRIDCPMLFLRGDESQLPDPQAAGLLAPLRHARTVTINGAGHWLHHDQFDAVFSVLRDFFAGGAEQIPVARA